MSVSRRPRVRLLPALALGTAVLLLVAAGVLSYFEDQFYRAQKIREVQDQAEILAAGVEAAVVFNDRRAAQEYVHAMHANPELLAVGVYPEGQELLAGFTKPGLTPLPATAEEAPPHFTGGSLVITVPVVHGNKIVGTVYLRAVTESTVRRLSRYIGMVLLAVMAALVLTIFASAQSALSRAHQELQRRALELADTNAHLQREMEERSKAEEALRQSQKMEAIGQLSGGIAHDFNNLLTVVKGNLHLLQRRMAQGRSDVGRYIDAAVDGVERAAVLTQRILAFSRRQPLSPQLVDLSALVNGMTDLLRHSVGDTVVMQLDTQSRAPVLCDANQMENVILNLAINARDAMPQGGRLTIETRDIALASASPQFEDALPGNYVRLCVADTGMGMSPDVLARAIDPFFTTKPVGRGTGLGLSMTFGYIRQSGGYLHIDSRVGEGTAVTILMPAQEWERAS